MADLSMKHLRAEHQAFEKTMATFQFWLQAAESRTPPSGDIWSSAGQLVRAFTAAARQHIEKEEQVLFPALEAFLPREVGPLAVLRGEHREMLARLAIVERTVGALRSKKNGPLLQEFVDAGRALVQLFGDHIYKEDRVLFPMAARFLSAEQDAALLARMQALGGGDPGRVAPPAGGSA